MPVIQARILRLHPVGVWFFAIVVFAWTTYPCLGAVTSGDSGLPALRIDNPEEVGPNWNIRGAWFSVDFDGFWGALEVQNVSPRAMKGTRFYAEYFDALGRLCFTLIFSQDLNPEEKTGAFEPNEVRRLDFKALSLAPAIAPKSVKLYVLGERSTRNAGELTGAEQPISAPATLEATSLSRKGWETLVLGPELKEAQSRMLDLVLARLTLDAGAKVQQIEILSKISDPVVSWFNDFIADQTFKPATRAGVPQHTTILLLVRAGLPGEEPVAELFPAFESPWVKQTIETLSGQVVPVIEMILFTPLATERMNQPGTLRFQVLPMGSLWSSSEVLSDSIERSRHQGQVPSVKPGPILRRYP